MKGGVTHLILLCSTGSLAAVVEKGLNLQKNMKSTRSARGNPIHNTDGDFQWVPGENKRDKKLEKVMKKTPREASSEAKKD